MLIVCLVVFFFFSSRRRHTRCSRDWSSDVCSSDLKLDRDSDSLMMRTPWNSRPLSFCLTTFSISLTLRILVVSLQRPLKGKYWLIIGCGTATFINEIGQPNGGSRSV